MPTRAQTRNRRRTRRRAERHEEMMTYDKDLSVVELHHMLRNNINSSSVLGKPFILTNIDTGDIKWGTSLVGVRRAADGDFIITSRNSRGQDNEIYVDGDLIQFVSFKDFDEI
uniref:Uncharacterized protein n=1 Tax=viral metagenome TaxID=1070528 RepID=A0A6C0HT56_9ZZZZ